MEQSSLEIHADNESEKNIFEINQRTFRYIWYFPRTRPKEGNVAIAETELVVLAISSP